MSAHVYTVVSIVIPHEAAVSDSERIELMRNAQRQIGAVIARKMAISPGPWLHREESCYGWRLTGTVTCQLGEDA